MRYRLKFSDTNDPLRVPWDIVVADTQYPGVLTVQPRHPKAGDDLLGFELEAFDLIDGGIDISNDDWEHKAIGLHPVFAGRDGGMYTLMGLTLEDVITEI